MGFTEEIDYRPAAAKRIPDAVYKAMVNGRLIAHEVGWDAYLEAFDPLCTYDDHQRHATERDFPEAARLVREFIASIEQAGGLENPTLVTKPHNLPLAARLLDQLTELVAQFEQATEEAVAAIAALRADKNPRTWADYDQAMQGAGRFGQGMGETRWRLQWLLEFEEPLDEDDGEDHDRAEVVDEDGGEQ